MSAEYSIATPPVPLYEPIQGDRTEFWKHLRATYGELAPVLLEPGVHAWLLLSYNANKYVMSNDALFARDPRWWRELQDGTISRDSGTWAVWHKRSTALLSDDAEHRYLSNALRKAFAQLDDQRTLGQIREVADDLIGAFAHNGQADLIGQYARLVPLHVLCRIFGMTPPQIAAITEQMSLIWQGHPGAMEAVERMRQMLLNVAQRARARPDRTSLPTLLIDQGHTDTQVGDQLSLVVSAASDPVTHTIGSALRQLLSDAHLAHAHARSTLMVSETINLILARHTPLETIVARHPRHDIELGSYTIRAGDCLVFGFAAASLDLYGEAAVEDVAHNRAHLTFGVGAHRCPHYGRDLALTIAETAIRVVTERLTDLRLVTPPDQHRWLPTSNLHGLIDLPVRFTPAMSSSTNKETSWTPSPPSVNRSSWTPPEPTMTPMSSPHASRPRGRWRRWRFLTGWRSRR